MLDTPTKARIICAQTLPFDDLNELLCRQLRAAIDADERLLKDIAADIGVSRPFLSLLSGFEFVDRTAASRKLDALQAMGQDTEIHTRVFVQDGSEWVPIAPQPPLLRSDFGHPRNGLPIGDGRRMIKHLRLQLGIALRALLTERQVTAQSVAQDLDKHHSQMSSYMSPDPATLGNPGPVIEVLEHLGARVELDVTIRAAR
ncbi:hypothetical protein [Citreimonas salinaria]|uniref:Uncharacterized protein n=1 Tax=Citreimonas salinaria TaxID=321339 RepID=A0A1H3M0F6_9RHOB|nr:hypothetical protein [Citreimonas salinaria]SDY70053.1 hypothetical protein SAMN05444340_11531 [Citreimonas salinaria]